MRRLRARFSGRLFLSPKGISFGHKGAASALRVIPAAWSRLPRISPIPPSRISPCTFFSRRWSRDYGPPVQGLKAERLRQIDPEHLVYESLKHGPGGSVSLLLTPLELIERLASLIRPPRRHRYYGVLAPNVPLRTVVMALAVEKVEAPPSTAMTTAVPATESGAADEPAHRQAARYVSALLLARIHEVLPLVCPKCGGHRRIIAFVNEGQVIREISGHLGEPISAPHLAPA